MLAQLFICIMVLFEDPKRDWNFTHQTDKYSIKSLVQRVYPLNRHSRQRIEKRKHYPSFTGGKLRAKITPEA